ncbi:MAG: helix-turn-helix transcriptional regulator [Polyangiaceae bacterium]
MARQASRGVSQENGITKPVRSSEATTSPPSREMEPHESKEDEMLTYVGLSRATGINVGTLYGMVCRNEIPHYRLAPRLVRFSAREIAEWKASRHHLARAGGDQ